MSNRLHNTPRLPALSLAAALFAAAVGLPGAAILAQEAPAEAGAARDPFWPVGFRPPSEEGVEQSEPEVEQPEGLTPEDAARLKQALRVQGFLARHGTEYAVMNGRWVTAGDRLTVHLGAKTVRLDVLSVENGKVQLEPRAAGSSAGSGGKE